MHFEYGSSQSDSQEAPVSKQIVGSPVEKSVRQERQPANELSENERNRWKPEGFQVKPESRPVGFFLRHFHSRSRSLWCRCECLCALRMARRNPPRGAASEQTMNRSKWMATQPPMRQLDTNSGVYCFL